MRAVSMKSKRLLLLAMLAGSVSTAVAVQAQDAPESDGSLLVTGAAPPDMTQMAEGPKVEGIISARSGDRMQVTTADGSNTVITIADATTIKSSGGFLGLNRDKLGAEALLNGLPVSVETRQWDGGLVASQIDLKSKDQRFAEQTAATEALRGRMGDIDQYNVKATTTVNFDTGQSVLSPQAKSDLCAVAQQAESMDNALLLVVGYTDSTGSEELNQQLSEKRAGRVVNYLQQACGWKPYRMLTPTGMAEADPAASNDTVEGKAQNRRVAVNILVSKGLDGL